MADTIDIVEVAGEADISRVAALAEEIWREHFTPIIGAAQVEYMLKTFQSAPAISRQIREEGYHYYFLRGSDGASAGYFAITTRKEELFLSKIYILRQHRGKGYARRTIAFIEEAARHTELPRITLTVNKRNYSSIQAYKKIGFTICGSIVTDIGNGFVMDDHAMEKRVG